MLHALKYFFIYFLNESSGWILWLLEMFSPLSFYILLSTNSSVKVVRVPGCDEALMRPP